MKNNEHRRKKRKNEEKNLKILKTQYWFLEH